MSEFVFWRMAWINGWATEQDISDAVTWGLLTQEQADLILNSSEDSNDDSNDDSN